MGPRKRPRRDNAQRSTPVSVSAPISSTTTTTGAAFSPLQPSQATTTSQVSSLSATALPEPSTPVRTSRSNSDKGMPPPLFSQLGINRKKDGISSSAGPPGNKVIQKTRSWYGSLSRKSTASTSLQRETIAGSPLKAGSTPDFSRFDLKRNGDTASLSGASQASVNALSKIHENNNPDRASMKNDTGSSQIETPKTAVVTVDGQGSADANASANGTKDAVNSNTDAPPSDAPPSDAPPSDAPPVADISQRPSTSSGWLGGWFSRTPLTAEKTVEAENTTKTTEEPTKEPQPAADIPETNDVATSDTNHADSTPKQPTTSWFGFWTNKPASEDGLDDSAMEAESEAVKDTQDTPMDNAPQAEPDTLSKPSAGSTWAFWSRDGPKMPGKQAERPEPGELAVMGEGSENHPKRTNSVDMSRDTPVKSEPPRDKMLKAKSSQDKVVKKAKKRLPQPIDVDNAHSRPQTPQTDTASINIDSPSISKGKTPTTTTKLDPPNILLPSFRSTYRMKENPSILKQIASLLLRTQQPATKNVFLVKEPPKIKKALAIGVHGLFPATYLRPMIGQPTGTSIKFANHCADGIRRWADGHGCEDCEIEKIALEGEGKIEFRVENLWKLLLNWIDHIREADLIVVACHSQGVPVSIMLLAKLVDLGMISCAKIGICAMAGVNLGPFPDYKSGMGILMGSAAELWEFADSGSEVSKRYETSLKKILDYGVRITYVGSIDDQLVPMESAIYSPANHPYIYRSVFIDGRIHAPDFIAHLVGFACKLRNLGISDHGLIRELSVPLAGSLYGGEGHSRLYDDAQVYDLAISHALETTNVGQVPCEIQKHDSLGASTNPYLLPWIMRGLLEEDFVKTELSTETEELLRQFDDWKPATKALKDVKYRLEAVRSRL